MLPQIRRLAAALLAASVVGACGPVQSTAPVGSPRNSSSPPPSVSDPLAERLALIDDAVDRWRAAPDLATARRAAEEARNLVVGPAGPYYGDADGDGTIEGASPAGLLPGLAGEPGVATSLDGSCVVRDVLGGSWDAPSERWGVLEAAIDTWTPTSNPFPTLPSHPQRIVGWATLALAADDLAQTREFAGHALLHVDVAIRAALDADCAGL